jgi:hypothetical protein
MSHPTIGVGPALATTSPPQAQLSLFEASPGDAPSPAADAGITDLQVTWEEAEVVGLHWRLLQELGHLQDPETPLDEKIDTLNWVFTEPDKDARPFSFVNCLRVVGCSPLSPVDGYFGLVDHEAVRDWIAANVPRWMRATVDRYPPWARELIQRDPQHVARQLLRDPQWLNEQVKRHTAVDLAERSLDVPCLPACTEQASSTARRHGQARV